MTTLRPKDIDVSKIKFNEVKKLDSGAKVSYINYDNEKMTIQLPITKLPYGLSSFVNEDNKEATSHSITVSFGGMDDNDKIKIFYMKMKEIEKHVITQGVKNASKWFTLKTKSDNPEVISTFVEEMFTEVAKPYRDKNTKEISDKYPPTMKIKLPYNAKNKNFEIVCHDMDTNEELKFEDIKDSLKGAKAQLVIQLTGIWISAGKFGCSWKILMGKFRLSEMKKMVYLSDSDAEKEETSTEEKDSTLEEDARMASNEAKETKKEEKKVVVNSDDDEEDDDDSSTQKVEVVTSDDEEEDDVPPPPTKGKKGAGKKK